MPVSGGVTLAVVDATAHGTVHLVCQGVNRATGVNFTGHVTWHVRLIPAKDAYRSHRQKRLHGSFSVQ